MQADLDLILFVLVRILCHDHYKISVDTIKIENRLSVGCAGLLSTH
jgi:hypothetical protein